MSFDPDGPDRDAWEADQAARGEAAADEAYFAWEAEQVAIVEAPGSPQHVEGHLWFQAAAGHPADVVLMSSFFDTDNGPLVVRREYVIELRDFLTQAIEGTLPAEPDATPDAPTIDL